MTILPTVMPDEFVLGYWGRIHILNLLGTPNQTAEALIDYFALPPSRIQRVEALALAANMDVQCFVHPGLPIKTIRRLPKNGSQWLYNNDREWLQEVLPAIWKR